MKYLSTIWMEPRSTIREIIDTDPMKWFYLLSAVYGAVHNLHVAMRRQMDPGDVSSFPVMFFANIIVGAISGMCVFYGFSYLLAGVGRLLGGRGSPEAVRATLAWGAVPYLPLIVVLVPLVIIGGESFLYVAHADILRGPAATGAIHVAAVLYFVLRGIMSIWSIVIGLVGLSVALSVTVERAIVIYICGVIVFVAYQMGFLFLQVQTGLL